MQSTGFHIYLNREKKTCQLLIKGIKWKLADVSYTQEVIYFIILLISDSLLKSNIYNQDASKTNTWENY